MYINTLLHCHFCIQIITDHFLLSKVSCPIHTIPGINAHLLYPILCPWKYSIRHKLLYCPRMYLWLFPWQPTLCSILPLFLYLGVLQEVDIISTVRPCAWRSYTMTSAHLIQPKSHRGVGDTRAASSMWEGSFKEICWIWSVLCFVLFFIIIIIS